MGRIFAWLFPGRLPEEKLPLKKVSSRVFSNVWPITLFPPHKEEMFEQKDPGF
jgi:hypothetical protein